MLLLVDNGSIFIKNITSAVGVEFDLVSFDKVNLSSLHQYDSFILSGRRFNHRLTNTINAKIIQYCVSESKKLLGICYGAEMLSLTLGGTIRKMHSLQKGNQEVSSTKPNPLIDGSVSVYQSHAYEIAQLGSHLESVASSQFCKHEIIAHKSLKIFGVQFHPEMTRDGLEILDAFVKL